MARPSKQVEPVARWRLAGDVKDSAGKHHGEARFGLGYTTGPDGKARGAAYFNGNGAHVRIADRDAMNFGTKDFSIAAWAKFDADTTSPLGDLVGKFDPDTRKGFSLVATASSPGYNSIANVRNLQFAIDSATQPAWTDCGNPWPSNPLVNTLTVFKGELYSGVADADDPDRRARVYRYAGGAEWEDCGRLGTDPMTASAYSLIVHKGELYGGTGTYDWVRAFIGDGGANHVYRYRGAKHWEDCGAVGHGYRVLALASLYGELYASDDRGECHRYLGGMNWEFCGRVENDNHLHCLFAYRGQLYGGFSSIYRYEGGTRWTVIGKNPCETTQTHSMQAYGGELYAGTWPQGKVLRYMGGSEWFDTGKMGIPTDKYMINEINALTVYNGKLYSGVLPKAELYRFDGDGKWKLINEFVKNREMEPSDSRSWHRLHCLTAFGGRLYAGTGRCHGDWVKDMHREAGHVHAIDIGECATFDDDLGTQWRHITAVRHKGGLKLYLDGKLASESPRAAGRALDLSNQTQFKIGFGAQNYFRGALADVRVYDTALTGDQVKAVAQVPA